MAQSLYSFPLSLSFEGVQEPLAATGTSRADNYYFTYRSDYLIGTGSDDLFYSYKSSTWVSRSSLPVGAQIFLITHCARKGGGADYVAEEACEKNAEYLRAEIESEQSGGGGASSAELAALKASVEALQTSLVQVQNTANSAVTKADTAQNTANSAKTTADAAQNTANAANTAAANVQTNVNNLTNVVNGHAVHYVGTAAPNNSVGKDGDVYLQPI